FCFSGSACFANEPVCARLAGEAGAAGIAYYPSVEAKVTESEKAGFYSAPNAECIIKGVFIDKDSYLTVYKSHQGWVYAMYVARDGKDFMGWLPAGKIKMIGRYDRKS